MPFNYQGICPLESPYDYPNLLGPKSLGGILKKSYKVIVAIAAASLVTSVAVAPANAATKQKVCIALDTGGINDKSFNQTSYAGATASKKKGWA